jgi:hypothetical protein
MYRFLSVPVLLCFATGVGFSAVDNGLLSLIPASARVVSSIDVQQARSSPFGQFLLTKVNTNGRDFDEMAQQTGFDPRRDLQSLIFASPGPASQKSDSSFVVLMRGTFDAQRIRNLILSKGGTVQSSGDVDVYLSQKHETNGSAFALADTDIAVFGDLASVRQVIANRASPTVLDPDLQALISKVGAHNDAWFASILGGSYLARHFDSSTNQQIKSQAQALQSVRQAAGGVHFGDTVQLTFDAVTRSPQDATSLVDVVRFMASLGQMQRQSGTQGEVLANALDNMSLNASGDRFHLSVAIPEKNLEQLADSGGASPEHHHGFKAATRQ